MKFKFLGVAIVRLIFVLSNTANAGIITHGYLTSDDTTNFITDTNTGRVYTRFDAFSLSAAETYLAIDVGGDWFGWSIATTQIADDFYAAALGIANTPCHTSGTNTSPICGLIQGWSARDFGDSFNEGFDFFAYKSDAQWTPVGLGWLSESGHIIDTENWTSEYNIDQYEYLNYLLYKDVKLPTEAPEPSTLAILALGMIGLASRRFKKH